MLTSMLYILAAGLVATGFAALHSMKNKKWKRLIVLGILCAAFLYNVITTGPKKSELPFRQPIENIAAVTIRDGDHSNRETGECAVVKELSAADGIKLILKLQELEIEHTRYSAFIYPTGIFVQINYRDGEVEQLTDYNNFWITPDGEDGRGGYHFEDRQTFDAIIRQYS